MAESIVLAFDLGGTELKAARVTREGDVRGYRSAPSRAADGAEPLLAGVRAVAEALGGPAGPAISGFGCPGVVDPDDGRLVDETPHVALPRDYPIRAALERALGTRVALDNDANLAALAEHTLGGARGARVSITVTIGTGVGCGIVVDGRIFRGAFGGAGELGHAPVGADGPACRCGVPGCAEPIAGGAGIAALARESGFDAHGARDVFASALPQAAWLRERMIDRLGQLLGVAVQVLNPDCIVIGGGVAQAGEALMQPLRRSLERYALASHRRGLRLEPARLGERAGVIGAGLFAWEALAGSSAR